MNKENKKIKVAVIGLGSIGNAIAANLVRGNRPVILSSREIKKAQKIATALGDLATAEEIAAAIFDADVVIPAIYFDKIKDFLVQYATELKGKIIIDVSNPIEPNGNGGFKKIIDKNASAGQILMELVPSDASLVKAFGTLGAASLSEAAFSVPKRKVLFYASDNSNSNKYVEELIVDSGFEPLYVGGINQSIRIEVFGDLNEFGALGKSKLLTLEEAKNALNPPAVPDYFLLRIL